MIDMTKTQALNSFWNNFGIPAYEESSVPDEIWDKSEQKMIPLEMPYITYNVATGKLEDTVLLSASLWYHETSWKNIELKADEIAEAIGKQGYYIARIDDGYLYIRQGVPFAQRMSDENPDVRRIYLNIVVEYLTAY